MSEVAKNKMNKTNKTNKIISLSAIVCGGLSLAAVTLAQGWNIEELSSISGLPDTPIYNIILNLLNWLLAILGIAGIIGFALAGVMYLLSAGNQTMTDNAKKAMTASILGVIVGLSGLVIIYAVDAALFGYFL